MIEVRRIKKKSGELVCDAHQRDATHQLVVVAPAEAINNEDVQRQRREVVWVDLCGECVAVVRRKLPRHRRRKAKR